MIGISGYGAYLPRLRMSRRAIADANAWYAPNLKGKGTRSLANWDEDPVTMAVAAARDCLGRSDDRLAIRSLYLASTTLPFAERQNATIVAGALTLGEECETADFAGSRRSGLMALLQGVRAAGSGQPALVALADMRKARPASADELSFGDGAAAFLLDSEGVIAEHVGGASLSVDFVDRFRETGDPFDYAWEDRWVRDEGVTKIMPRVVKLALANAGIAAEAVDHFIMPTAYAGADAGVARSVGIAPEAVAASPVDTIGDCGAAQIGIVLASVLERAKPGAVILLAQFGSGAQALLFRTTAAIGDFRPQRGVAGWLALGKEETSYTKFLSFKGQVELDRGMRGEQDLKTALSTAYRHRGALLGLVAGRCSVTGEVSFPPSRIIYSQNGPLKDTQQPHKLADRPARLLSWSAEYLSFHRAPPHCYGQVDFDGGGRILMEFTDTEKAEIESGIAVETTFRIKAIDELRGFRRYFWKVTPIRGAASVEGE